MTAYEEATSFLGEKGPYYNLLFFAMSFTVISIASIQFHMVFGAAVPEHHCSFTQSNLSTEWIQAIIPLEVVNGQEERSSCSRYKLDVVRNLSALGLIPGKDINLTELEKEGCIEGWSYSTEIYHSTIVTEWDVVCDNNWKVPLTQALTSCGALLGCIVSGALSDRFGRKKMMFFCIAALFVSLLVEAFSPSFEVLCISVFLTGSFNLSVSTVNFVLATELFSKPMRELYSSFGGPTLFFTIGNIALSGLAYGTGDWRTLLIIMATALVTYIPFWWVIPESPRWLISQGRLKEAEAVVRRIAKNNKVEAPHVIFQNINQLVEEGQPKERLSAIHLLKKSDVRCITIMSLLTWVAINLAFYGISYNSTSLTGSPYLNYFLSATMEVPANMASLWFLRKCKRRLLTSTLLGIGGALILLVQLVPNSLNAVAIAMEMFGKLISTMLYAIIFIYTAEIFPTVVRSSALGLCSSSGRFGSIAAPYIVFLGIYGKSLPYVIMGTFTLISSSLLIFLPETFNTPIPETLEQMQKGKRICWKEGRKIGDTRN